MKRLLPASVIALAMPFLAASFQSCQEEKRSYVDNISDGNISPSMITSSVETFISDSGYTRYHITAPIWKMYDNADEPFWKFDSGLELQVYDRALRPESFLVCDSATYWSRLRRWRLDGHVAMMNVARDSFLTSQLFYDDARNLVYTDSFIHIVKSDRILEGYGLESNKTMTQYSILRPTAILPVSAFGIGDDGKPQSQKNASSGITMFDSVPVVQEPEGTRKKAPRRASERNRGFLPGQSQDLK